MAPKRSRATSNAESNATGAGGPPPPDDDSSSAEQSPSPAEDAEPGTPSAPPSVGPAIDEEEEDGEELIGEDMHADYRPMGALDEYEADGIDENEYDDLNHEARAAADAELRARDQRERPSRMPAALLTPEDEDEEERPRRRRREEPEPGDDSGATLEDILGEEDSGINLEDYQGSLGDWIQTPAVREEIKRRFRNFLIHFDPEDSDEAESSTKYSMIVRKMCTSNRESLQVSYMHLSKEVPILAIWVADAPKAMLELLDVAAMDVVRIMFPEYEKIQPNIHVRITDLPIQDSIRDLRQVHMGCLVKVSGVVTRRSGVFPQLKVCKYNCGSCGYVLGPFTVQGLEPKMAGTQCPSCQNKGPYSLNTEQTIYCNYQQLTLQESPSSVPAGRLPRQKSVVLTWDLIDMVKPGEEIEVTGTYATSFDAALNRKSGFPVFATVIEANHVMKKEDADLQALTDQDRLEIHRLSKNPQIRKKIIDSIAPSIFGHLDIKTSIALSLFGGQAKDINGKHRIRGDINVLLLGDPGTAKSQFLKYVQKVSPRAVYTTGQGASAVGLTAAVHRDSATREWVLEGGALVLADKGVCLIDEFDKMNDSDRTSIHEAMEQQTISIAKAGIKAQLPARCAVIAAANPVKGRYDSSVSFHDNVDLSEPILSRFDCVCVVKDEMDPIADERLAEFVVRSHKRSHPEAVADDEVQQQEDLRDAGKYIDQALLRKYIMYARTFVRPVLRDVDVGKITQVYTDLRRESQSGGVSVAVRHIESIIRMAEASARMHLRDQVRQDDVDLAISVMLRSVINSQKYAVKRSMEMKFSKYLVSGQDANQLIEFQLRRLFGQAAELNALRRTTMPVAVLLEDFESRAKEVAIEDLSQFYQSESFLGDGVARIGFRRTRNVSGAEVLVRASDLQTYNNAVAAETAT